MTSTLIAPRPVGRPPVSRRTAVRLAGRPRRLARAAHVIVSAGWLGLSVAMVSLGVGAALSDDATFAATSYDLMARLGGAVIAAFAVATLVSGVLLSLTTPWGLARHRWVVVKLVLTVTVIVTAVGVTNRWVEQAATGGPASAWLVVAGSASHLLLLAAAALISVDKPWGLTRRGRRMAGSP